MHTLFFEGNFFECVHHACNVNRLRTPRRTCQTSDALPDGLRTCRFFYFAALHPADDCAGDNVHLFCSGTASGAFSALIAIGNLCMCQRFNASDIRTLVFSRMQGNSPQKICLHRSIFNDGEKKSSPGTRRWLVSSVRRQVRKNELKMNDEPRR